MENAKEVIESVKGAVSQHYASRKDEVTEGPPFAGLAQLGEHLVYTQDVAGSSPVVRTKGG